MQVTAVWLCDLTTALFLLDHKASEEKRRQRPLHTNSQAAAAAAPAAASPTAAILGGPPMAPASGLAPREAHLLCHWPTGSTRTIRHTQNYKTKEAKNG